MTINFPSFSEGLSLRGPRRTRRCPRQEFPFLFGGTFIEGMVRCLEELAATEFPFLFGGTFIEGDLVRELDRENVSISLPFRRDFH